MKKPKSVKWAQMSKLERAWAKLQGVDRVHSEFPRNSRPLYLESAQFKRARNTYNQMLKHWCDLKKLNDAQKADSSLRVG